MEDKFEGGASGSEFGLRKVYIPRFVSQRDDYNCVPASLLNAAQIMGWEITNRQGGLLLLRH